MGVAPKGPQPLSDIAPRVPLAKMLGNQPCAGHLYFRSTRCFSKNTINLPQPQFSPLARNSTVTASE